MTKAHFKRAVPYADDAMNLPVNDLEVALPFYLTIFGLKLISRSDTPHASAVLARDDIEIGLTENGGDPTQEGCFFEVDDLQNFFQELQDNGLNNDDPKYSVEDFGGDLSYKVFYVVAPDGLCYCIGEQIKE